MTRDETLAVLAHMAGAWPKPPLQPEQVEVWVTHMADIDAGIAQSAALELEAEEEFFPRIARFKQRCGDISVRRYNAERQHRRELMEAEAVTTDSPTAQRAIAEIRKQLAGARGPLARDLRSEFDS